MLRSSTHVKQMDRVVLNPFTKKHNMRIVSLRHRLQTIQRHGGSFLHLLKMLSVTMAPSTAASYGHTLAADLRRQGRQINSEELLALQALNKLKAGTMKKARLPETPEIQRSIANANSTVAATMTLQCITSSRHADLKACKTTTAPTPVPTLVFVRQHFVGPWKSDRQGSRSFCRFSLMPTTLMKYLQQGIASYGSTSQGLKSIAATPHSLRVWALETLSRLGYSFKEIQAVSGHTPTSDEALATRRYITSRITQPESCRQLRMTARLLEELMPALRTDIQLVLQTLLH